MAEALLKEDVHILLFNMLCKEEGKEGGEGIVADGEEEEEGGCKFVCVCVCVRVRACMYASVLLFPPVVSMVGTEILFNLSCVRNFKEEMLASAVRHGVLEGVRVLVEILGADVNIGEEPNTPICLAVTTRNKEMVEVLIQLGVNNVHHALSIAKETKQDDIIGLLLKKISLEHHGDVINLSGLELLTLKPQWILPSLGVKETRTKHKRSKSMPGHVKKLFLHRTSCSSIPDRTVEALRLVDRIDEPDSGIATRLPLSRSMEFSCRKHSSSSASSSRKMSSDSMRHQSRRSSSDSITTETLPSFSLRSLDSKPGDERIELQDLASPRQHGGVTPEQLKEKLEAIVTSTPNPSTPRRKLDLVLSGGVASNPFSPTLPTIHGTPTGTLKRTNLFPTVQPDSGLNDQGMESLNLSIVSSPMSPNPRKGSDSTASVTDEHSSKHTPRRRPREKNTTITGAKRLPFSSEEQYSKQRSVDGDAGYPPGAVTGHASTAQTLPMSPKLLQRRLTMLKHKKGSFYVSSWEGSRSESPMPLIYDNAFESHEATLLLSTSSSSVAEAEYVSPPPNWCLSPKFAARAGVQFHEGSGSVGSSTMSTPSTGSRRESIDAPVVQRMQFQAARNEADFGVIPEEDHPHSVAQKALVRVLDISSNQIASLDELAKGGSVVLHRLSGLHRLDMKQNNLSCLPRVLLEVQN